VVGGRGVTDAESVSPTAIQIILGDGHMYAFLGVLYAFLGVEPTARKTPQGSHSYAFRCIYSIYTSHANEMP
jgi:hypothetical protein